MLPQPGKDPYSRETGMSGAGGLHLGRLGGLVSDSTIYTIGTALNRAHDNDIPVQILVEGQWITGQVVAVDGHGVVINGEDLDHAVIRMDSVSAVRIFTTAPGRTPLPAGAYTVPGPRTPYS